MFNLVSQILLSDGSENVHFPETAVFSMPSSTRLLGRSLILIRMVHNRQSLICQTVRAEKTGLTTVEFTRVISAGLIASFNPYIMSGSILEKKAKKKAGDG
jgi:hypothetical protein